jgi:hypothetical protein
MSSDTPNGDTALGFFEDGNCTNCNSANTSESLQCLFCRKSFHLTNCGEVQDDFSLMPTQFDSMEKIVKKSGKFGRRPGNYRFACTPCLTKLEVDQASTTNDTVQKLDNKVSNLSKEIGEIKSLLRGQLDATSGSQPPTQQGTSQLNVGNNAGNNVGNNVWSNQTAVSRIRSRLVVDKNVSLEDPELQNSVFKSGLQVHRKYPDKTGNIVIECNSQKTRDELKRKLIETGVAEDKLTEPKPRYPTISIVGIDSEMDKTILKDKIMDQNTRVASLCSDIESVFDITAVKPLKNNPGVYQAFVRVSDSVRNAIKSQGDRLYFGWGTVRVYDQLYVRRCNRCQGYGHYMKECKNTLACGLCAKNHESVNCPHKLKTKTDLAVFLSCVNCKAVGTHSYDHAANSSICHMFRDEQDKLKKTLSSESSKNY